MTDMPVPTLYKIFFPLLLITFTACLGAPGSGASDNDFVIYEGTQLFAEGLQIGIGDIDEDISSAELWISLERETTIAPGIFVVQPSQTIAYRDYKIYVIDLSRNSRGRYIVLKVIR